MFHRSLPLEGKVKSLWLPFKRKFNPNGVSICVMTRIFRGQITQKIKDFYKEFPNFLGILTPKTSGYDAH